jgi:hypothetical protein
MPIAMWQDRRPSAIFVDLYGGDGNVASFLLDARLRRTFLEICIDTLAPGGALIINCFNDEVGSPARTNLSAFVAEVCAGFFPGWRWALHVFSLDDVETYGWP